MKVKKIDRKHTQAKGKPKASFTQEANTASVCYREDSLLNKTSDGGVSSFSPKLFPVLPLKLWCELPETLV